VVSPTRYVLLVLPLLGATAACQDAVHDDEVSALGPEAAGVSPGPDHRPGQPCTVCHGGNGPAKVKFTLAGTVFMDWAASAPAVGAELQFEDANGNTYHVQTNQAGNFYLQPGDWSPTFPVSVPLLSYSSSGGMAMTQQMTTNDNRDGSCASCHGLKPSATSPGPIYVKTPAADGG
jgi:hypothetical protein